MQYDVGFRCRTLDKGRCGEVGLSTHCPGRDLVLTRVEEQTILQLGVSSLVSRL